MRQLISSGSKFEAEIGYSRAVVDGDWIFVSGTTGFDYQTMTIADDVVSQVEQCMRNIAAALEQANATIRDVVRVRYPAARRGFRAVLADPSAVLRRRASGGDDDGRGLGGPATQDRDRGDGAEAL